MTGKPTNPFRKIVQAGSYRKTISVWAQLLIVLVMLAITFPFAWCVNRQMEREHNMRIQKMVDRTPGVAGHPWREVR